MTLRFFTLAFAALTSSSSLAENTHATFADAKRGNGQTISIPLVPHHVQKERRRHLAMEDRTELTRDLEIGGGEDDPTGFTHQVGALFQGYGTHYVDLWVGTPPQRQTVIVSTGSKYAAFPCSECDDCGYTKHIDTYFEDEKSSTFKPTDCSSCFRFARCRQSPTNGDEQCRFSESYQEGSSWNAFEASDIVYLGGLHDKALPTAKQGQNEDGVDPADAADFSFRFTFGCQTNIQGLFKTQMADGMLGMCNCDVAFWKQMYSAGKLNRRQFSLCFNRQPLPTREGKRAGALTLGGADVRLHDNEMQFANLIHDSDFFEVQIKTITLRVGGGERSVPVGNDVKTETVSFARSYGRAILDSGTTDTYLLSGFRSSFERAWKSVTGEDFFGSGRRTNLSHEQLAQLPTLLFDVEAKDPVNGLNTIRVAFPPSHYMEYDIKTNTYTCRFYFETNSRNDLGANFLMGHDIMFDIENNRVGFAESECDYSALVAEDKDEQGETGGGGSNSNAEPTGSAFRSKSGTVKTPPSKSAAPPDGRNKGACSGIACRLGMFLLAAAIGGVATALFMRPELFERFTDMIRPRESGLYERAPAEIPMANMGQTELPQIS